MLPIGLSANILLLIDEKVHSLEWNCENINIACLLNLDFRQNKKLNIIKAVALFYHSSSDQRVLEVLEIFIKHCYCTIYRS